MNEQFNHEVLMVLPRKTVYKETKLEDNYLLEKEGTCLTIFCEGTQLAKADLLDADDFGMVRPRIVFEAQDETLRADLFVALMSRMALEYDQTPSKYALYIRLNESDLELIAQASRMGFVPYFGQWNQRSAQESEEDWQRITEALRIAYPGPDNALIH